MLNFLKPQLKNLITSSLETVYEVRLRVGENISLTGSVGKNKTKKILNYKPDQKEIERAVLALSDYSLYCKEESLKRGTIVSSEGERVGVCGEMVYSGKEIVTVKNFSSLCIRIPHDIKGCCKPYIDALDKPRSCLVISPPFHGKTTFIRDLGRNYSDKFGLNVLYLDERDELSCNNSFYLGANSDVIRYCDKKFGFYNGVRSYNPDVIVCDELMSIEDINGVRFASLSGVVTLATAHSDNLKNLLKKQDLSMIIKDSIFDDIVLLNNFKIIDIYREKDWLNL